MAQRTMVRGLTEATGGHVRRALLGEGSRAQRVCAVSMIGVARGVPEVAAGWRNSAGARGARRAKM